MPKIDIVEAKSNLPELVRAVETGEQEEIILTCKGVPSARLVRVAQVPTARRLGVAEGKYVMCEDIDRDNNLIAEMFGTKP